MEKKSIFSDIIPSDNEEFLKIVEKPNIKIERIVSSGQSTPEGFWYNQKQHEFVIIIQGNAVLEFEEFDDVTLKTGDYIDIPPHCKHRVRQTSLIEETIWLAIFYDE